MKSEISKKNPYWIPKDRYLELKHWCHQYDQWKDDRNNLLYLRAKNSQGEKISEVFDPTFITATKLERLDKNISMVDTLVKEIFPNDWKIFKYCLVSDWSYDVASIHHRVTISRSEWYKRRREFFYWLDKRRE